MSCERGRGMIDVTVTECRYFGDPMLQRLSDNSWWGESAGMFLISCDVRVIPPMR